ncbi:bifunctional methylenetetrahydrofolate dehydrogenase/methenyltetrahydrofolate cyclohydrolase FolD [Fusobacterium sp.]|uniref:bifunctional methylenetetrahydrofolate dehydrogenase/methenyltetrahydrofolate cyclohydrolase FolD n=1 Tax=Fusobacterium sp. TaxID=68766 RepID=UPI00396CF46B
MTVILDGKNLAKKIRKDIKEEVALLKEKTGKNPGLAIVLVGEDPASKIYVNSKIKGCKEIGMESFENFLPKDVTEEKLLEIIEKLNKDERVNGILVQLPLPSHIDEKKIIAAIALEKDVDGFKPDNLGLLFLNDKKSLHSCTPAGIMRLLDEYNIDLKGLDAVIVGRSNIVGKPLAGLFINRSATVTICNSHTKNLKEQTKNADVVVMAVGKEKLLTEDMVKEGAVIVDVGINRTNAGVVGDVDFENVAPKAKYITPVPGGVGPMTVAMLFHNTLKAFKNVNNIE